MPGNRASEDPCTPEEIVADARRDRERIDAARKARGMNDSDATLRERAHVALERLERTGQQVRSDWEDQRFARERREGRADPLAMQRIEAMERDMALFQRDLRLFMQTLTTRGLNGDDPADERRRKPEYQAYRQAFMGWIRGANDDGPLQAAIQPAFKAAAITSDDTSGGFLVPFEMEKRIERVLTTVCAMRGITSVKGMVAAVYKKPFNVGGSTGGWVAEQASRPQTNTAKWVMMEFPAFEYYSEPAASQTMFDDAGFDVEGWLADEASIVATESEGDAFINGDGIVKPRGFLGGGYTIVANTNYPTKDQTTPSTYQQIGYVPSGVAADLTDGSHNGEDGLIDLVHSLRPGYRARNPRFLMNDFTLAKIRKFKDSYGQYLWQTSANTQEPGLILGYGYAVDENMPSIGANTYPIAFADWATAYLIVDRTGMRLLRDPYTAKPFILFYNTRRVGGGVQNFEAIKLLKVAAS